LYNISGSTQQQQLQRSQQQIQQEIQTQQQQTQQEQQPQLRSPLGPSTSISAEKL
jgi:hypothetical protein